MSVYDNRYDSDKTRYTHRDYESIKEDLIKAIPSLTQEWTSREDSDPGIVLIKLMAIFGDTLSYNVDKIALELYIQSVTQRKNCAKILELLGYKMHWYRSARVLVHAKLSTPNDSEGNLIHFLVTPLKSIFKAGSLSYTVALQGDNGQIDISSQYESVSIKLIQGTPASTSFTKNDLVNNRFYLNTVKVDESEFNLTVTNAGRRVACELVSRLYLVSDRNRLYYEFNVDEYDRPYIKLDDGWEDIVSSDDPTFNLQYIVTDGSKGNVSSNAFTSVINSDEGSVSYRNLIVDNLDNTTKYGEGDKRLDSYNSPGYDPQTVSEAKIDSSNYVFTHDTLVTSSDYEKAARRVDDITVSKLVDAQVIINDHLNINDICDRANDYFSKSVDLISTVVSDSSTNILAYADIEEIKSPSAGDYFEVEFNHNFGVSISDNPAGLLILNSNLPGYQEYTYPIYKTVNSLLIEEGKKYILYFNPTVTSYLAPGETSPVSYPGRWDLYDNASQIRNDHTYLDHHMIILYLGYKDFNWFSNSYYSVDYDSSTSGPWTIYGLDPYSKEYNFEGAMVNKDNSGYYPYKPLSNIIQSVRDLINNLHVLNVNIDYGTIKLFPFKVKGTLYLVEPLSPEDTYQIYLTVNEALTKSYYPDLHPVGEKPNFIEIVDIIQNSDSRIKYFDAIDNIVEWAPAINTDPSADNYIDKIFDTTSAIRYNGLSDEFNFDKKFMIFKLKNTATANFGLRLSRYGTEGQEIQIPDGMSPEEIEEGHTAYLFNYSRAVQEDRGDPIDDNDVLEIGYNMIVTIEVSNVKQLKALCQDLKFSGVWVQNIIKRDPSTHQPVMDGDGNYIYEMNRKLIDNTGIRWQE